jgi:hypothetical protein
MTDNYDIGRGGNASFKGQAHQSNDERGDRQSLCRQSDSKNVARAVTSATVDFCSATELRHRIDRAASLLAHYPRHISQ